MVEGACRRCGACCHWIDSETKKKVKCPHLVNLGYKEGRKLTSCRIYHNRINRIIGKDGDKYVICILRSDRKKNYPNCPQNKDEYSKA